MEDNQPEARTQFDKLMQEEKQIMVKDILQSIEQILEEKLKESLERASKSVNSLEKRLDKLEADEDELELRVDESLENVRDLQKRVEMNQNDIRILWNSHDEVYNRLNAGEVPSTETKEHLEQKIAHSNQRSEIIMFRTTQRSLEEQKQKTKKLLYTMEMKLHDKVETRIQVIVKEVETLKHQLKKIRRSQNAIGQPGGVSNPNCLDPRRLNQHTPAISGQRVVGGRQTIDICDDLFGFGDEHGKDFFGTPEERREDFDRRNSLEGGSIFSAILAPVEPANTYMISSVKRESYSHLVLRDITLDCVGPSIYEPISQHHTQTPWSSLDDCRFSLRIYEAGINGVG